jgi:hypothetical protein
MSEILSSSDNAGSSTIPDCPYRGLRAYTEADGEYFFGRDSDRDLVIANLLASRLTVLYGPSGVGKSSLLQAGVMRHLRRMPESAFSYLAVRNAIIVYNSSWHSDSLAELGDALVQAVSEHDRIEDIIQAPHPLSVDLLHHLTERLNSYVYLLLDQFEDQASYQTGPEGAALLAELGHIVTSPGLRVSVLVGIREDALAKLGRLEDYVPRPFDNNLQLNHLNRAEAREAIEGPLVRYNSLLPLAKQVTIQSELIDELLPQLQTGSASLGDVGQGGVNAFEESIETPFLQFVMTRLWAEEAERGSRVLRRETLATLGGVDRIVGTHIDAVMSGLTHEQQEVAAEVLRYLVTPSGRKISLTAYDLADFAGVTDPAQVKEVLEKLAASRELVLRPVPPPLGSDEAPRYEVFHDVIVPAVVDWRRRYITERQRIASEQALLLKSRQVEQELREARKRFRVYALLFAALALLLVMSTVVVALALRL